VDSIISLEEASKIVIKIGSALLLDKQNRQVNTQWLKSLCQEISVLVRDGKQVSIVSSGSIALGRLILNLNQQHLSLEQTQAAAACGQIKLARTYEEILHPYGLKTAQILLTLDDNKNRRRYLNARSTVNTLLGFGVIPIINENDTVATDEIRFGDNDRLAAQVAVMIGAEILVLFSDIDGLYDKNPKEYHDAKRIPVVEAVDSTIMAMGGKTGSELSSGGMKTKLLAARTATQAGCAMVISNGFQMHPLTDLRNGGNSTWFKPRTSPHLARKQWISSMKTKGKVVIDAGAQAALKNGKSLLPAGVIKVIGEFEKGDPVEITTIEGEQLCSGLIRYSSTESRKIKGYKSQEIIHILGFPGRAALIHKDDMSD